MAAKAIVLKGGGEGGWGRQRTTGYQRVRAEAATA